MIEKVLIEKVTLPENLRKLYNDQAEEAQRKKAQSIRLAADIEKANTDAAIAMIQSKTEADKITMVESAKAEATATMLAKVAQALKKENLTEEQISHAIRTYLIAHNENAVIYLGDNNNEARTIAAGISGSRSEESKGYSKAREKH